MYNANSCLLVQVLYEGARRSAENNPVVSGPIPDLLAPLSGSAPVMDVGFAFTEYAPEFDVTQNVMRVFKLVVIKLLKKITKY